jgi:hypothetical protein
MHMRDAPEGSPGPADFNAILTATEGEYLYLSAFPLSPLPGLEAEDGHGQVLPTDPMTRAENSKRSSGAQHQSQETHHHHVNNPPVPSMTMAGEAELGVLGQANRNPPVFQGTSACADGAGAADSDTAMPVSDADAVPTSALELFNSLLAQLVSDLANDKKTLVDEFLVDISLGQLKANEYFLSLPDAMQTVLVQHRKSVQDRMSKRRRRYMKRLGSKAKSLSLKEDDPEKPP